MLQRSLSKSDNYLSTVMERLSTGQRINSASDDPFGLSMSVSLDTRSRGLNVANQNIQTMLSKFQMVSTDYSSMLSTLEQMKALATQATSSSISSTTRNSLQGQANSLLSNFSETAASANDTIGATGGTSATEANIAKSEQKLINQVTQMTESAAAAAGYTVIETVADFEAMTTGGKYILMSDIDFSAAGSYANNIISGGFTGEFNGNGFTLSNISLDVSDRGGIFEDISGSGVVKNLVIENSSFSNAGAGTRFGFVAGGNLGNVENVSVINGSVIAGNKDKMGLIVGENYASGTVSAAYSSGTMDAGTGSHIGGIAGINNGGIVTNSYSEADLDGNYAIGGILGNNYVVGSTLSNSFFTGTVNGDDVVGGIIGRNLGDVSNSYSTGAVTGNTQVAGIAGYSTGKMINTHSTGSITGSSNVGGIVGNTTGSIYNSYSTGTITGNYNVGGIAGQTNGNMSIANVYATGDINHTGDFAGGIVGSANDTKIKNANYSGILTGADYIGGIVGLGANTQIEDVYSTNNISGAYMTGGIVGEIRTGSSLQNAYSTGTISSTNLYTGGVLGNAQSSTIKDVYATGDVSGTDHVGGVSANSENSTFENIYSTGDISGNRYIGGAIGSVLTSSYVENAYSTGNITGTSNDVGGIIGHLNSSSQVTKIYKETGNVTGINGVGGLVGAMDGGASIDEAYVGNITVTGTGNTGGIAGFSNALINNVFSEASIDGTGTATGGIIGGINVNGVLRNSWSNAEILSTGGAVVGYSGGNVESSVFWNSTKTAAGYVSNPLTFSATGNNQYEAFVGSDVAAGWDRSIWTQTANGPELNFILDQNIDPLGHTTIGETISSFKQLNSAEASYMGYTEITTAAQFEAAMDSSSGKFILMNDIDLSAYAGSESIVENFDGEFNGNGYKLTGVDIVAPSFGTNFGIFDTLGSNGVIRNLVIENATVTVDDMMNSIGTLAGVNDGLIENIAVVNTNFTSLASTSMGIIGGLVGENNGEISSSYSTGHIEGVLKIGGLVGENQAGNIGMSFSQADVNANGTAGGLVGEMSADSGNIAYTYASGDVTTTSTNYAGGLVGYNQGTTNLASIKHSYATGNISSINDYSGGLIGYDISGGDLEDVYATGTISTTGEHVGGLIGSKDTGGTITNAYATGITSGDNLVGGLAGSLDGISVYDSYATGNITASERAGGLVGNLINSSLLSKTYATGNVSTTTQMAGGLVGSIGDSIVEYSYATGDANGGTQFGGGLAGYMSNASTVRYSYSTGTVTGDFKTGGIAGEAYDNSSIINSWSSSDVLNGVRVGGIAGGLAESSSITGSFSTGLVTGQESAKGGAIGYAYNNASVSNVFWNTETSGDTDSHDGSLASGTPIGLTSAEIAAGSSPVSSLDDYFWVAGADDTPQLLWNYQPTGTAGSDIALEIGQEVTYTRSSFEMSGYTNAITVQANETNNAASQIDFNDLGINFATGITVDLGSQASATATLADIDVAIEYMTGKETITNSNMSILENRITLNENNRLQLNENLSQIRDADIATETTNMMAEQMRYDMTSSMFGQFLNWKSNSALSLLNMTSNTAYGLYNS